MAASGLDLAGHPVIDLFLTAGCGRGALATIGANNLLPARNGKTNLALDFGVRALWGLVGGHGVFSFRSGSGVLGGRPGDRPHGFVYPLTTPNPQPGQSQCPGESLGNMCQATGDLIQW